MAIEIGALVKQGFLSLNTATYTPPDLQRWDTSDTNHKARSN